MRYRIEFSDSKPCKRVGNSKELIECLGAYGAETIADIRKEFKSGASDSVMEIYAKYLDGKGKN